MESKSDTSPSSAALDEWSLKFPASGVGSSTGTVGPVDMTLWLAPGTEDLTYYRFCEDKEASWSVGRLSVSAPGASTGWVADTSLGSSICWLPGRAPGASTGWVAFFPLF